MFSLLCQVLFTFSLFFQTSCIFSLKLHILSPKLIQCNCSVLLHYSSIVYNKEQLCSKGDIDVTGENATSANETSCGSFREITGSSMKGSYTDDCGCDKIQIDCKAHNCTYNDNCKCTASSIQVDGSNAHASSDTRCDTFQCHCGA